MSSSVREPGILIIKNSQNNMAMVIKHAFVFILINKYLTHHFGQVFWTKISHLAFRLINMLLQFKFSYITN